MERLQNAVEVFGRAGNGLGSVAIVVMMLLICGDIIGRYILRMPIAGAFEFSEFLMVGIIFVGFAHTQAAQAHIKIDLLVPRLSRGARAFLNRFNLSLTLVFFALITWRGGVAAWRAYEIDDRTAGLVRLPFWPAKAVVPIGAGLLCLQILVELLGKTREGEGK